MCTSCCSNAFIRCSSDDGVVVVAAAVVVTVDESVWRLSVLEEREMGSVVDGTVVPVSTTGKGAKATAWTESLVVFVVFFSTFLASLLHNTAVVESSMASTFESFFVTEQILPLAVLVFAVDGAVVNVII